MARSRRGQPTLLDPRPAVPHPRLTPRRHEAAAGGRRPADADRCSRGRGKRRAQDAAAQPPRRLRRRSTRSAAALALSAEPVFDEGTYQRIKEALLSYSAIQVRGGWPALPADAKLAPGASGPTSPCCAGVWSSPMICAPSRSGRSLRRGRHRSGQALPVASRAGGHRQRRRADAEGAQRAGRNAHQTARSFARAPARHGFHLCRALRRGEYSGRLRRGGRHDKVERRYRVIVGKIDKPSPTLTAFITAVNLNPTWTVPLSITKTRFEPTCAGIRLI